MGWLWGLSSPPPEVYRGMVMTSEVLWTQAATGRQIGKGISDYVSAMWMMGPGEVSFSEGGGEDRTDTFHFNSLTPEKK